MGGKIHAFLMMIVLQRRVRVSIFVSIGNKQNYIKHGFFLNNANTQVNNNQTYESSLRFFSTIF
jgi:hypothetical protein